MALLDAVVLVSGMHVGLASDVRKLGLPRKKIR